MNPKLCISPWQFCVSLLDLKERFSLGHVPKVPPTSNISDQLVTQKKIKLHTKGGKGSEMAYKPQYALYKVHCLAPLTSLATLFPSYILPKILSILWLNSTCNHKCTHTYPYRLGLMLCVTSSKFTFLCLSFILCKPERIIFTSPQSCGGD